jgi:hypothetical protein
MCLACSTPVRGRAFGSECLPDVLGADAPTTVEPAEARPQGAIRLVMAVAFGGAVLATTLPWSRFGPGSGAFGAWTRTGRWSMLAALAAVAGLALAVASLGRAEPSRARDLTCTFLGGWVALASALSLIFPPAFSRPWLGPWVGLASGVVACAASVVAARAAEKSTADI